MGCNNLLTLLNEQAGCGHFLFLCFVNIEDGRGGEQEILQQLCDASHHQPHFLRGNGTDVVLVVARQVIGTCRYFRLILTRIINQGRIRKHCQPLHAARWCSVDQFEQREIVEKPDIQQIPWVYVQSNRWNIEKGRSQYPKEWRKWRLRHLNHQR